MNNREPEKSREEIVDALQQQYEAKKDAYGQAKEAFDKMLKESDELDLDTISDAALEAHKNAVAAAAARYGEALKEFIDAKKNCGA